MELNREQIIMALECCTRGRKSKDDIPCLECPYNECNLVGGTGERQTTGTCQGWLMKDALALIKHLTEENDARKACNKMLDIELRRLGKENEALQNRLISSREKADKAYYELACEVKKLRAENERLIESGFEVCDYAVDKIRQVRADTVREMQERLKGRMKRVLLGECAVLAVTEADIKQILNE